jgi:hypothetical protein
MGSIVPEAIEQYLAGLDRLPDSVLKDIAQAGRQAHLPLIDLVTDNVLWSGEVVPGFVKDPRQDAEETRAIADYNNPPERASRPPDGHRVVARRCFDLSSYVASAFRRTTSIT